MTNSRQKGARAERELAHKLTELLGVKCRRGQQLSGAMRMDIENYMRDIGA